MFLVFLLLSQKNLNFKNLLNTSFIKLLIYLVKSKLIFLIFKKINQSFQKKIESQHTCGQNHLPVNKCLHNTRKGGHWGRKGLGVVKQ